MTGAKNLMEIKESAIREHYAEAYQLMTGFEHAPRIAKPGIAEAAPKGRSPGIPGRRKFRSTTPGLAARTTTGAVSGVHLIERIQAIDAEDPLTSETETHVVRALRRAIAVAGATVDLYAEQTALEQLKQQNLKGRLAESQRVEFGELLASATLVGLFTFANLTAFLLSDVASAGEARELDIGSVEEIVLDNPGLGLKGALWELDQKVAAFADDDPGLVAAIIAFAEGLMEEVKLREKSGRRLEAFVENTYRVEADDFQVEGFTPAVRAKSTQLVMAFKKPEEVIGNHIAKYQCLKLAKMLMAYDFTRQLNPFAELGGFIFTFLGDGQPGTGKTTLIQMLAGLLHDYCGNAGYPFRYENLASDAIDSYQGKSAQNAKAFIRAVTDPKVIGFGTVDDIDQIAGKRGDRQSSAGQQEVTATLMESFGGANTLVRGNCTFGMFSNYPENVDDALRQRAGARFLVDGPQTLEDYIDILALLLGRNHDLPIGEHDLYVTQEIKRAVAASYEKHDKPQEKALAEIFHRVLEEVGELDSIAKLGRYLKAIQSADDRFTGRAIKNITDAVKVRTMDFELPDEWMERPELFLAKDYETKMAMITELMRPMTTEMVVQEVNRYADSEFRYAGKSDEAAIETMVRDLRLQREAHTRFSAS
jgi:energy-coupling factor transporter ATP-binding protein EcfA2